MKTRLHILLFLFIFSCAPALAQNNSLRQLDVALAAPDAAEIAKYGNLEVNLFKGVPNVQVPIHTLQTDGFSLPVYLAYDASGIKVDQIASSAGLGWSLHAGGQITVAAYGKDDFLGPVPGFIQDPDILEEFDPNRWASDSDTTGTADYLKAWDMYDPSFGGSYKNLKPDLFYYSFAGSHGKFVVTGDIQGSFTHYTVPYRNLKLSYSSSSGFEITDQSGHTYIFDVLETASTQQDPNNCGGGPGSENGQAMPVPVSKLQKTARTWHLGKIITASGDEIVFTYDSSQTSFTYTESEVEQRYERVAPVSGCLASITDYNCLTTKTVAPKRLAEIEHVNSGQQISFLYSSTARQDFGNSTYTALDSIIVKNHGERIKAFDLDTDSYFGSSGLERLKLSGIQQEGYPSGYTFEYSTNPLPARLSKSQDHWGYYNGKGNSTLIPDTYMTGGGDRSVVPSEVGAWSLQRINYPTGGSTVLNMEGIPTGGGLRVASSHDLDGMGNTTATRHYTYEASNVGNFNYSDQYEYYLESDYTTSGEASCVYNMYTSSHLPPVQSMDSPDYGFSKVTVTYDNGSSGKTEHLFSHSINDLSDQSITDPGALRWGRGELLRTIHTNAAGDTLAEQQHTFKVHKTQNTLWGSPGQPKEHYIYGVDIQLKRAELTDEAGGEFDIPYTYPARFDVEKYRIISAWYHPDLTISTRYDPTDTTNSLELTTTQQRLYNSSSARLSTIISTNSDGQVRKKQFTYASEQFPGMAAAHMLTQPFEVALVDSSGNPLRFDWTFWNAYTIGGRSIWKPCSEWSGGPGVTTPPDDPDCN